MQADAQNTLSACTSSTDLLLRQGADGPAPRFTDQDAMPTITSDLASLIAPTGTLRSTVNFGNPILAQQDGETGEPRGVSVDLATELGRRLGVPTVFTTFDAAGKALASLKDGTCDIGFLAIDPVRAADVSFTAPYVAIEGTYVVRSDSRYRHVGDLDQAGVRIAAGKNAAYDLFLSRNLRHATLAYAGTSGAAMDLFVADGLDASAGIRQPLTEFARARQGLHVLDDRFMVIEQAMAISKTAPTEAFDFVASFVDEMKKTGFVAESLRRSGQSESLVA